jgi:serpin B
VDEQGTEAAVAVGVSAVKVTLPAQIALTANHPFLFSIREHRIGTIVFMGKVGKV